MAKEKGDKCKRMYVLNKIFNKIPKNWKKIKDCDSKWALKESLSDLRPLLICIKEFNSSINNSNKVYFGARLGEFKGISILIAPLRSTLGDAKKDCFLFMRAFKNIDKDELRYTMWKIALLQKKYSHDYCYKNPCTECDLNCVLSSFVFQILDLEQIDS